MLSLLTAATTCSSFLFIVLVFLIFFHRYFIVSFIARNEPSTKIYHVLLFRSNYTASIIIILVIYAICSFLFPLAVVLLLSRNTNDTRFSQLLQRKWSNRRFYSTWFPSYSSLAIFTFFNADSIVGPYVGKRIDGSFFFFCSILY